MDKAKQRKPWDYELESPKRVREAVKTFTKQFDRTAGCGCAEGCKDESMTVPDMHMTPQEMLDRFTRGQPILGQVKEPLYFGNILIPKINDFTELDRYRQQLAKRLDEINAIAAEEITEKENQDSQRGSTTDSTGSTSTTTGEGETGAEGKSGNS